jgi:hypothetical protein
VARQMSEQVRPVVYEGDWKRLEEGKERPQFPSSRRREGGRRSAMGICSPVTPSDRQRESSSSRSRAPNRIARRRWSNKAAERGGRGESGFEVEEAGG